MKSFKSAFLFFLSLSLILSYVGCGGESKENIPGRADIQSIKIGALLPLTGNMATVGQPKREAIDLAVKKINSNGGIKGSHVSVVFEDSQGQVSLGISALRRFLGSSGFVAYFVDLTPVALATIPIIEENKALTFLGTAHPSVLEQSKWCFRFFPSGKQEASMLSSYFEQKKIETVWILYVDDPYGDAMKRQFEAFSQTHNFKIVGAESFKVGQEDVRSIMTKAAASKAQKIVFIGYGITFPTMLKQAHDLGIYSDRIVGNIGFIGNPALKTLASDLIDGIVFTAPRFALDKSTGDVSPNDFIKNYETEYGKAPTFVAAYTYDAIMLLAEALLKSESFSSEDVKTSMLSLKRYDGVTGKIEIRDDHDFYTEIILATYSKGKILEIL